MEPSSQSKTTHLCTLFLIDISHNADDGFDFATARLSYLRKLKLEL